MAVTFKFDPDRTKAAILYLASKDVPELTTYKICKLLFLADKYHLVRHGRTLTGDTYFALPDGPVPSNVYDILKGLVQEAENPLTNAYKGTLEVDRRFQFPRFHSLVAFDADELSMSDLAALDKVVAQFGKLTFAQLKAMTHEMPAFSIAWESKDPGEKRAEMDFEDFFDEDADAIAGTKESLLEDQQISKALRA